MQAIRYLLLPLLLAATCGAAAAEDARLAQVWPEHQQRLREPQKIVDAVNADPGIPRSDAEAKAVVEELLAEAHLPLDGKALLGEWRVRSLQGTRYGVFPYPWFKARVTQRDGKLFFEKLTGSQRRSGWLLPPADAKGDWYFVGGASVNEDPQVGYSKADGASEARSSDSVGLAWGIAEDRVLMLLDTRGDDYEIYQLKRP